MLFAETSIFQDIGSTQIAAISGLIIGVGLRVIEKILNKGKDQLEEHVALRKELREELDSVKEELHGLRQEVDEWRQKYYDQVGITNHLTIQVEKLTNELDAYKRLSGIHTDDQQPELNHNGWFKLPPEE